MSWQDQKTMRRWDDSAMDKARKALDDRNWLALFYMVSAYLALVEHGSKAPTMFLSAQEMVPAPDWDSPHIQITLPLLEAHGWLAPFYASCAYLATVQNDGSAAGLYTKRLRLMEESRTHSRAVALFNTMLDEYFDAESESQGLGRPSQEAKRPSRDQDHRKAGLADTETAGAKRASFWTAAAHMLRGWCPFG